MNSRRVWTEEDKIIDELVKEYGTKNWAMIAIQLSKRLKIKARSGKQCRQRWHNHLDPCIQKKGWDKKQEQRMFQLHKKYGNKWTVIAEQLPGRTDNAIKNYFYSTIRRSLRRMGKFVGSKNSTQQMKKIKPSTLSKIFAAGHELMINQNLKQQQIELINYIKQNCESVRDEIIQFTNYKPKRNDKASQNDRDRFERIIIKMIYINDVYQKIKMDQKRRRYQQQIFHKDYNKLMLSSDSQQSIQQNSYSNNINDNKIQKTSQKSNKKQAIVYYKSNNNYDIQQDIQVITNIKNDSPNHLMPTVIIKSQNNLSNQQEQLQYQNPDFQIQLKQDFNVIPNHFNINTTLRSPAYYFNTPKTNPFGFFQSPSTPKNLDNCFNGLQNLGVLQNSAIDQFQMLIQKQIECNLSGQQRKMTTSISTIGSPGSAFRYCGIP